MACPYTLDLAFATAGQLSGPPDRMPGASQGNDALMGRGIRDTAHIFARGFGQLDALALPLAASLIVIPRHLQGQF
jgi:hypothetical protein